MVERSPAPDRVPTLTEVVVESALPSIPVSSQPRAIDEDPLVEAVLGSLQQRVDLMFEYRVREALTPVLQQLADELVARARLELGGSLREVVARAVAQELRRQREQRGG